MTAIDVTAIIVNWNTRDLLQACLLSLSDYGPKAGGMEIIVVDNGSTDGSVELVRENWPDVRLEALAHNEGYTRANNVAIPLSRGRYLLLINADAQVQPGSIDRMIECLDGDDRAAVVGPRLVYGDGSWQRWTAGNAPDLIGVVSFFLFGERVSKSLARRSLWLAEDVLTPYRPDWVSSACMLVRREAVDQVGMMDERYFCYMDDVDLCQRFRDAGWHVWYDPRGVVVHLMGQSTRQQTGAPSPAAVVNFNDYFTRRNGRTIGATARGLQVLGLSARAASLAVRSLVWDAPADRKRSVEHLHTARNALRSGHV